MSDALTALVGADIFDGTKMRSGRALLLAGPHVQGVVAAADIPAGAQIQRLTGGVLAPGYVDLQVNGGGGVMFNDDPSVATLKTIARAHARLGATTILPTLITDTPAQTAKAVAAVEQAVVQAVPGIAGLHLEGPHLSLSRKGAHDPALIRPMQPDDLELLLDAADRLPVLMATIAPESVTPAQMQRLAGAGILLSLGHSDASLAECQAATAHGVRCVTHLFNAMSQLGNREPGLVGAALALGELSAGLIADLIHVHPQTIATALRAKRGPGSVFLVSDAMATAGSDIAGFVLNGRRIARDGDRLTLADGTLAGAHLDLTSAVRNMARAVGLPVETALAMATSVPAGLIGQGMGILCKDARADVVHLTDDLTLASVWQGGVPVSV